MMKNKLKALADQAAQGAAAMARMVGDLNGDGKVDEADLNIAVAKGKRAAGAVADEAARLAKDAVRGDMARDVAAGAAVGAAIAIPAPIIGPAIGAVAGAGVGLFKNLNKPAAPAAPAPAEGPAPDLHAALLNLDDLRQKGILTEEEFAAEKAKLLRGR